MPKFRVRVLEVHYLPILIEAETAEEALELVQEGGGEEGECVYGYTLESDSWTVVELQEEN
jgi:hypothetical protein